jgi:hypothetical protein
MVPARDSTIGSARHDDEINLKTAEALGLTVPHPAARRRVGTQFLIVFAALLAASAASAQVGSAPFCLATDSEYGGSPGQPPRGKTEAAPQTPDAPLKIS